MLSSWRRFTFFHTWSKSSKVRTLLRHPQPEWISRAAGTGRVASKVAITPFQKISRVHTRLCLLFSLLPDASQPSKAGMTKGLVLRASEDLSLEKSKRGPMLNWSPRLEAEQSN